MRTSKLSINGKDYILCMSNRVLVDLESRGKNLQSFLTEEDKTVTNICWLLRRMSEAGSAYARMAGLGEYPCISEDEILDSSGSDDYQEYMRAITEAASGERHVDAVPPKNVSATQEEDQKS